MSSYLDIGTARHKVTIDDVVKFLNNWVENDRTTVERLIHNHVSCLDWTSNHPSIQVVVDSTTGRARVGVVGLLNGLFGVNEEGLGPISAVFDIKCPRASISGEAHDSWKEKHPKYIPQVGESCPVCNSVLQLGRLQRFITVWSVSSGAKPTKETAEDDSKPAKMVVVKKTSDIEVLVEEDYRVQPEKPVKKKKET